MTAAERVKAIRQKTGMTQAEFGKKFDIPRRTIENWESGKTAPPPYVVKLLSYVVDHETERGDND